MATHSSIHTWETPWTEEPGGLQSMGSQRFGHCLRTHASREWLSLTQDFLIQRKKEQMEDFSEGLLQVMSL